MSFISIFQFDFAFLAVLWGKESSHNFTLVLDIVQLFKEICNQLLIFVCAQVG